jgi:TP901 family phage tail tape measure protein
MKNFKVPTIFSAVDKFSQTMKKMQDSVKSFVNRSEEDIAKFERKWRGIGNGALNVAKKSAVIGALIAAPLVVAANEAIAFEDRMADVAKTTGLTGKKLDAMSDSILKLAPSTRTTIEELQQIAAIGGAMGVAEKELGGFVDSVNKFNVALGSDFQGGVDGASRAISGLKVLFKETRNLRVDEAITKAGSAINALSSKGVNVPEVTEFISRVGQLPDAIKPSIQNTAALGATLNKAGLTAEIASRAFGDILLTGAQNLPKFAKQMGVTNKEASDLINNNPTEFAVRFAKSLNGLSSEKLAKTLKTLKLTDAGAIKVVGALGSSIEMLSEFQKISNEEFAKGTSLLNEYNTKNQTTAAKLKQAKNSFEAFSIILGRELLPMINELLMKAMPIIKGMIKWASENKKTVKTILLLAAGLSALSFVVSGVSSLIWIFSNGMLLLSNMTKVVTAAQWLWNAAITANPIGLIVVAIAALIGVIALVIHKWNEWGAALSLVMGPLGFIISLVQSFRRNWDMITESFSKGGIIAGLKAIGKVIVDALLMPMEQLFKLIAKVTGANWAKDALKGMQIIRKGLGVNVTTDESGNPLQKVEEQNKNIRSVEKNIDPLTKTQVLIPQSLLNGMSGGGVFNTPAQANQSTPLVNPLVTERELIREERKSEMIKSKLIIEDQTGRGRLESNDDNISLIEAKVSSTMTR